jgi:hypothetical protein
MNTKFWVVLLALASFAFIAMAGQQSGAPQVPPAQPAVPAAAQPTAQAVQPTVAQPAPPAPTGDALIDRLNANKFQVAPDWIATSALVRLRLDNGKKQAYQVQLPGPPYCHTYVAVGDDAVQNLDLSIESPTSIPEAKDSAEGNVAVIQNHCPIVAGAYKLTVTMTKGGGEFAIQVFSKSR